MTIISATEKGSIPKLMLRASRTSLLIPLEYKCSTSFGFKEEIMEVKSESGKSIIIRNWDFKFFLLIFIIPC